MCAIASDVSEVPFVASAITFNRHSQSLLLLVCNVHHVVSCLLIDSHRSSTCNSQTHWLLQQSTDLTHLLYGRALKAFTRHFRSFLGTILTCTGNYVRYVVFGINRRRNDESARLHTPEEASAIKGRHFSNNAKIKSREMLWFTALIYGEHFSLNSEQCAIIRSECAAMEHFYIQGTRRH